MSYFAYCYETYRQIRKIPMLQSTQIKLIICDFNDFVYDRKLLALPAKKSNPLPTQPAHLGFSPPESHGAAFYEVR